LIVKYNVGDVVCVEFPEKGIYKTAIISDIFDMNKFGESMKYCLYECILQGCGEEKHYYLHKEIKHGYV